MANRQITDVEEFRRLILHETGVSVCSRIHFGRPLAGETQQYVRFAYSGIDSDQIVAGLNLLKEFLA